MISIFFTRPFRLCAIGILLVLISGCSALRPAATTQPAFYALDNARSENRSAGGTPALLLVEAPTLIVNPPHAASGFDSQRIIYVREAHKLEYYAHSEWVDTPARMLAPLIVASVGNTGAFRAVVQKPSAADGDLRLDTEIVRLQHDIGMIPGRVRFTLRAYIVDDTTRQIIATREFDETTIAASEDPIGGVVAANRAVQAVLDHLASFCAETATLWLPVTGKIPKRSEGGATGY